jgi:hypothetical protein
MSSLTAIHIGKHSKPVSATCVCTGLFVGGGAFLRSPFLPAVWLPLEISNCADRFLFTGCHNRDALEEAA